MKVITLFCVTCSFIVASRVEAIGKYRDLEFIEACSKKDPGFDACLAESANRLVEHFRHGLPRLGYSKVEPIILDEVQIALGGGPNGYKAQFKDVAATGVSHLRVTRVRSKITADEVQVQLTLSITHIHADAKYRSSGTLILVQASGAGDYWGDYDGVNAKVFIKAVPFMDKGRQYLELRELKMDFNVSKINMGVKNVQGGNTILQAALNLFINSNSQELLKEMKPDLRKKLVQVMTSFVKKLFSRVPYDAWVSD